MAEISDARARQIDALGQELPKQTVGVFAASALPRRVWTRQFRASMVDQLFTHGVGRPLQLATETLRCRFSCAAVHLAKDLNARLRSTRLPTQERLKSPLVKPSSQWPGTSR